ncbi:hypothetical protein ABFP37_15190 [Burkholderia sp. RS01]|uniref:hypothetical protein n=1 Tax=unclassified Burkholderia TaxID=2613784 RepID=UPI0032186565
MPSFSSRSVTSLMSCAWAYRLSTTASPRDELMMTSRLWLLCASLMARSSAAEPSAVGT